MVGPCVRGRMRPECLGPASGLGAPSRGEGRVMAKTKSTEEAAPARPPADPRLKVLKKFQGKFLPKGVLRQRYAAIMERWDSGDDHGGVTVEELKTLLDDWRGTREKPPRI